MRRSVFVLLALSLGACSSASDDAENICRIFTEGQADTSLEASERAVQIARRIEALNLTADTEAAFAAVANAPPDMRYPLLQRAFEEQGVEGWECPAMRSAVSGAGE